MKPLALIFLIAAAVFAAPFSASAAADSECIADSFTCNCLYDGGASGSFTTEDDGGESCREDCKSYLSNGDVNWYYMCQVPTDVVGQTETYTVTADTLDETSDVVASVIDEEEVRDPIIPNLNVPIPGLDFGDTVTYDSEGNLQANFLAQYIDALYRFLIVAMAIVAVVMMMIGGLQYILARGHADAVKKAKERMANAVVGLVLLFAAYDIAFLINPDTVRFEALTIPTIQYEEVPEELTEDLETYGQTGSVDEADVMTIPEETYKQHITVKTREKRIAEDVYNALIAAADDFYNMTQSDGKKEKNIVLTSASRTVEHQAELFYQCFAEGRNSGSSSGYCSTACNPARNDTTVMTRSGSTWTLQGTYTTASADTIIAALTQYGDARDCYHTNNIAVDVWSQDGGGKAGFNVAYQGALTAAMFENGFCRIANEPWHFELDTNDQASSNCSQNQAYKSADYKSGGTTYSTSGCKIWSYNDHCCSVATDNASKPASMCN